ncbi:MAG: MFS transporter [Candidatus Aenigmatarchaeota archaeon]
MPEENSRLKYTVNEGIAASVMYAITGGFLTLFALALGASNAIIGLMVSLPAALAALSYIPAAYYIEKTGRRHFIAYACSFISRIMWIFIGLIPFIATGRIEFLLLFAAASSLAGAFVAPAWASMMADIVPRHTRGVYFGRRNMLCAAASLATTIIAGVILDNVSGMFGFTMIFLIAGAFGVLSSYYFFKFPKSSQKSIQESIIKGSIASEIKSILAHKYFSKFLLVVFLWEFGISFSGPFLNVYIVKELFGTYFWVSFLAVIAGVATVVVQRGWGRVADIFGNKTIISIAAFGVAFLPLFWMFAQAPEHMIPINILSGIAWAGFNLALFNYVLEISPPGRKAMYSATYWTVMVSADIIAPVIGGLTADIFSSGFISGLRLVFLLSWFMRFVAAVILLRALKETKHMLSTRYVATELFVIGFDSAARRFQWIGKHIEERGEDMFLMVGKQLKKVKRSNKRIKRI